MPTGFGTDMPERHDGYAAPTRPTGRPSRSMSIEDRA